MQRCPLDWLYSLAGLVVGFVVGLTGIGGGALMTPILMVGFGVPAAVAVSTDLLYASVTKAGGIFEYAKRGLVKFKVAALLLLGSVPSSSLTLIWLGQLSNPESIEVIINLTLGISLILTSLAVFFRSHIREFALAKSGTALANKLRELRPIFTVLAGLLLGGLVTLSSVGAGALGTAILILLYPRWSMAEIVGTDLLHAVLITGFAGLGHYQLGTVDFARLGSLLIGSLPGVWLGSRLGATLSPKLMQPIMGSLLMTIGLKFVLAS